MSEPINGTEIEQPPETDPSQESETPESSPWLPSPVQVHRYMTPEAVADAAAKRFLDTANRALEKLDHFVVALAGGSTPRLLYQRLTESPYRERVPWDKTFFVFGDERCVGPDDESSNYRMAKETLFDPLEIPAHRVLRMKGEETPADAARRYAVRLGDLFLTRPAPSLDLVLLGIGTDGHTASLFPGTEALDETERWVVANHVPALDSWRLTLTFPILNKAKRVIFLATGESKARIIAEAFGGLEHAEPYPCERVAPLHVRREALVDFEAASMMPHRDDADADAEGDSIRP